MLVYLKNLICQVGNENELGILFFAWIGIQAGGAVHLRSTPMTLWRHQIWRQFLFPSVTSRRSRERPRSGRNRSRCTPSESASVFKRPALVWNQSQPKSQPSRNNCSPTLVLDGKRSNFQSDSTANWPFTVLHCSHPQICTENWRNVRHHTCVHFADLFRLLVGGFA